MVFWYADLHPVFLSYHAYAKRVAGQYRESKDGHETLISALYAFYLCWEKLKFYYFLNIQGAIFKDTAPMLDLFVLIKLHFSC